MDAILQCEPGAQMAGEQFSQARRRPPLDAAPVHPVLWMQLCHPPGRDEGMQPRLVIEAGEAQPNVCTLQPDQVASLGRNEKNTIVLQDRHASRWHAEILPEDGRWVLRDRETLNGTLHNK